ncbi:MAG: Z1 domain-containing protein, partial [Candidatus Thiodiazotropha sp. (ex Lucinoma borealis)]|nr:Z1 domain-containing protein [Candidatus Thiodiazotropha sp. (ex Lucinoma borealis)]
RIFSSETSLDIVRHIDDNEDLLPIKHKNGHRIDDIPESLKEAVRCFILARTIRLFRRQTNQHNSMLVNASRFTIVQAELRNVIHSYLDVLKRSVRYGINNLRDPDINTLFETYRQEYAESGADWSDLTVHLHNAISVIEVVEVNSSSSGKLLYSEHSDTGYNVIAVGGFSLSRGLTLEGLTVSYFLRNSMMYDTLMQMGRWFGYRQGYEDVCRIWMAPDAHGWYAHITQSIEELREELREMELTNLTPKDFGLKVRSHPDTLIVTARNKMGSSEQINVRIGLSNQFIETTSLWDRNTIINENRRNTAEFIGKVATSADQVVDFKNPGYLWTNVSANLVIDFIGAFRNHPLAMLTANKPVQEFIHKRARDELAIWDVAVISKGSSKVEPDFLFGLSFPVNCQERTVPDLADKNQITFANHRVASRGVEKTGLTDKQIKTAEQNYLASQEYADKRSRNPDKKPNYPDKCYRAVRQRPLLIIHLVSLHDKNGNPLTGGLPAVAWGISFPVSTYEDKTVEYRVNTTWWRENIERDIDEEEFIDVAVN